ncbi:hypothetical protein [Streptosporangium sp. H16]|uniref:hypothetical protein n=1 Tax=Streptosporangium sp. H16 TaxID=3444184 RepID=UPI003F7A42B3
MDSGTDSHVLNSEKYVIGVAALRVAEHQRCPAGPVWHGILTELLDGDAAEADRLVVEARRQLQTRQEVTQ